MSIWRPVETNTFRDQEVVGAFGSLTLYYNHRFRTGMPVGQSACDFGRRGCVWCDHNFVFLKIHSLSTRSCQRRHSNYVIFVVVVNDLNIEMHCLYISPSTYSFSSLSEISRILVSLMCRKIFLFLTIPSTSCPRWFWVATVFKRWITKCSEGCRTYKPCKYIIPNFPKTLIMAIYLPLNGDIFDKFETATLSIFACDQEQMHEN